MLTEDTVFVREVSSRVTAVAILLAMKTIEVIGHVDENHHLSATVPAEITPGPVKLIFSTGESEDEAGRAWASAIAREWAPELSDPREDIYTLNDGEPVNGSR